MCEIVAAAWPEPRPLRGLLERALEIERFGIDGFGWGVAWLDAADPDRGPCVRGYRSVDSLADDTDGRDDLDGVESTRFVIHMRRPTLLSTVDLADTQPFVTDGGEFAVAHNGRFDHHERFRSHHADRLAGRADSEIGFRVFEAHRRDRPAIDALHRTLDDLGGYGNFVYLGADGEVVARSGHHLNPFWRFHLDGGVVASTACHSEDDSVFRLVFTDARSPVPVAPAGEVLVAASQT